MSIIGLRVFWHWGQKEGGLTIDTSADSSWDDCLLIKLWIKLPKIAPIKKNIKKSIKNNLLSFCKEITKD